MVHEEQVHTHEDVEVTYRKTDWLIFAVSFSIMLSLMIWDARFFWMALPFAATFLVKSLRMM